jgi:hypothetical protein
MPEAVLHTEAFNKCYRGHRIREGIQMGDTGSHPSPNGRGGNGEKVLPFPLRSYRMGTNLNGLSFSMEVRHGRYHSPGGLLLPRSARQTR